MVGVGDNVEGCVGFSAAAWWFDSALRKTAGRLTTNGRVVRRGALGPPGRLTRNGLGAWLVDEGFELGEVGVFGVAARLDEEGGDGDLLEMTDGVWQEDAPAGG